MNHTHSSNDGQPWGRFLWSKRNCHFGSLLNGYVAVMSGVNSG
ncbi:hypothetical protein ACM26V_15410 [Salipaludibacillus sp. HK11]